MTQSSLFGVLLLIYLVTQHQPECAAQLYLGRSQHFLMSPYYFFRTRWPTDVNRQHSSNVNWLRSKEKPVFCKPDKSLTSAGYTAINKQPKQADFLDFRATEEEKRLILELHNQLRQKVASGQEKRGSPGPQPAADFMPDLKWDKRLADSAWEWAKYLAQNRKFENGPEGTLYGQNLGFSMLYGTSSRTWDWVIDYEWSYGVNHMNCGSVGNFRSTWSPDKKEMMGHYNNHTHFSKPIGRYTQMVWAGTTHVGCAAIGYSFHQGEPVICLEHSGLVRLLYVCNYNPPGNIVGQPIYKPSSHIGSSFQHGWYKKESTLGHFSLILDENHNTMTQWLFHPLLLSFMMVLQVNSSPYWIRTGKENLNLPDIKEQPTLYCNTEPSRPIPSNLNNVRSHLHPPYLFRDGEQQPQDRIYDLRATEEDKKLILDLHNQLRQKVASKRESRGSPGPQPAAIFMPNLKWSDELARNAWQWAQNLQYKHEPDPINYGQNLHMSFSSHPKNTSDWANIINGKDGWFDEVDYMDCTNVVTFKSCQTASGKVIGHYTQMVWAETIHVGCASIGYYDDYNGYPFTPGQPYKQFYICNYSPRGNSPNQSVYKVDYSSSSDCQN
uniref:SCP domain-containing protein n=1 Tax=Daphnia galeata TaxID=27404 RepID=A0A8J2RKG0_9CRUS|nr:unnamed protein product [Daphnia galeata]